MALDIQNLKNLDLKIIDLKNIYEWPILGRAIVIFLVCLMVFFLGYFFDFSNLGEEIFRRYKQEQDLKQQVKAILKTEQSMKHGVSEYPQLLVLLNQWQEQLISESNLPDLLNQILKLGAANHIKFSLFAPSTAVKKEDYNKVSIKVVIQGDYSQLAHFISEIANLPQIVVVGDFVISKKEPNQAGEPKSGEESTNNDNLICELTLEVFSLANKK